MRTKYDAICIDFEFRPFGRTEGNPLEVICMVAHRPSTGEYFRLWGDALYALKEPPFPTGPEVTFVAYYASAEIACFRSLGWSLPARILDLYAEFRNLSNGLSLIHGRSLLGALQFFGLPAIEDDHKEAMRQLALRGGDFTSAERSALLEYCQSDVDGLRLLLDAMSKQIDYPRAILRGTYCIPLSMMESHGCPIDHELYADLVKHWEQIKAGLVERIDASYGVYDGGTFKENLFEGYLTKAGIDRWPRHPSGKLKLDDNTFKEMALAHPQIRPLRQLRDSLSKLRLSALQVGFDGRNRCLLSAFSSVTGRNQPSTNKFVFGLARWARGLIRPKRGFAIAYIDWSQQEFGIAAALSGDLNMQAAYRSGDPYLEFAKQAGAVPQDATKTSHPNERNQYKQCVLATQYGMGADSLAAKLGQPTLRAKQLLDMHRKVYRQFWAWSDSVYNQTVSQNWIQTVYGWQTHVNAEPNPRSLRNFPMQANAADMLRVACILMAERGIKLCAPVHDAILIEAPEDLIDAHVAIAQSCMKEASKYILSGFALSSEAEIIRYPDRFLDEDAGEFWGEVMGILADIKAGKF